jgi:hypothetical protein
MTGCLHRPYGGEGGIGRPDVGVGQEAKQSTDRRACQKVEAMTESAAGLRRRHSAPGLFN